MKSLKVKFLIFEKKGTRLVPLIYFSVTCEIISKRLIKNVLKAPEITAARLLVLHAV